MSSRFIQFIICGIVLLTNVLVADTIPSNESFHRPMRQRDFDAVQRFVNSKRTMDLEEKEGFLKIAGDLRFEYGYRSQEQRYNKLVEGVPTDVHDKRHKRGFDSEINLKIAYKCEHTEAFAKLFFDGNWGIDGLQHGQGVETPDGPRRLTPEERDPNGLFGSGGPTFLALKECWVNHIFWEKKGECGTQKIKGFIGRSGLDKLFRSRLQFNSRFNGVMGTYSHTFKPNWDAYGQLATFVVDERSNHYAYIGEVGTLDFFESKLDIIYSLIYWKKHGANRAGIDNPRGAQFINSQLWLAYNFPTLFPKPAKLYSSFVYNHAAKRRPETHNQKQNFACDVGFLYGGIVKKAYDWTIEMQYQYVQTQSINEADMNGIGRGNFGRETFTKDGRGSTNFHGYKGTLLFAFTDSLQMEAGYQQSWELRRSQGGLNHYHKTSVELIQEF